MRILVIGGAGYVARLTLQAISREHELTVYDLRAPGADLAGFCRYVEGDVLDAASVRRAVAGHDILLYLAMGDPSFGTDRGVVTAFETGVTGVYIALHAAHEAGITHAVYASSMSVYAGNVMQRYFADEDVPPDAVHVYGLSKRLGEEVCRAAAAEWQMSLVSLRLCHPMPDTEWVQRAREGTPTIATAADDVARAILAALAYRATGFEAFMISGDYEQKTMSMSRAKRLLGWAPAARPSQ